MAVIYVPPNPNNFAGALGAGVGQGISSFTEREMKRQEQQQIMARQMQALNAVQQAKSREEALSILTTPGVVNNPQELGIGMKIIDALHPPKDETPQLVTAYDQTTGAKKERFVKKGDLPTLNDPNTRGRLFGGPVSLDQPSNLVDFFSGDQQHTELGKLPLSQRPEGAMTKDELTMAEKRAADERANKRLDISTEASTRAARAAERSAAAAERGNEKLDIEKQRTAVRMLQDSINVKKVVGANGELTLDWSGETDANKMKAYHAALGDLDNAIKRNKGNVANAVADLQKKYFPDEEKPQEPAAQPKVDKPQQGAVSRIINDIGAKIRGTTQKKPKEGLGKRSTPQGTAYEVASQKDYDMLDVGDKYITSDGQVRTKGK